MTRPMPYRNEKLQELLHREVARILERDFAFAGALVTVTQTEISPDHTHASVHVSVFPDKERETVLRVLEKAVFHIQQTLNKNLRMRPVPKVRFALDSSQERASRIYELIESTNVAIPSPKPRKVRRATRTSRLRT